MFFTVNLWTIDKALMNRQQQVTDLKIVHGNSGFNIQTVDISSNMYLGTYYKLTENVLCWQVPYISDFFSEVWRLLHIFLRIVKRSSKHKL